MDLNKLAEISQGRLLGSSIPVDSYSIDTRTLKSKEIYIALEGDNYDGHEFISEAALKGAAAAVVSKSIEVDIPHIIVDSTHEFMKNIADYNRSKFNGKVIGITGTNGKTSTKQIVSNLLNENELCHKTLGNKNNQIGVPYSLLTLRERYKYSVIEMGTSEPGEIEILNNQVKPNIAAITNVSKGHLEGLRDTESIAKEKGNILNFCSDSGNAALSIAISLHLGIKMQTIKERLTAIDLPKRRLTVTKSLNGSTMIDDTYNSNPASLKNALDSLEKVDKTKICILGEMKELGPESKRIHTAALEYAYERVDKILCLGNSWSDCIIPKSENIDIFTSHDELYDYLVSLIDQNTILLIKGSRSTRMDLIADKLKK